MIKTIISAIVFILFLPLFTLFLITGIVCSYFTHMRNAYYPLIPFSSRLLMLVSFQRFSVKGQAPKKEMAHTFLCLTTNPCLMFLC